MAKKITVYIDGGSRGNPGPAASAYLIIEKKPVKTVIAKRGIFIGNATANIAEYYAGIYALKKAKELYMDEKEDVSVEVISDSELLVKQLNGFYRVKNTNLKDLFKELRSLTKEFERVNFYHISREENKVVDELVNLVLNLEDDVIER